MTDYPDTLRQAINDHDIANAVEALWLGGKISDDICEMIAEKAAELCALRINKGSDFS